MARKKKQKRGSQPRHAPQRQNQAEQRLEQAKGALKVGNPGLAVDLAASALRLNPEPTLRAAGQTLLVEAHFRAAAATPALEKRLTHLEAAIALRPDQARLHHHAGATLLRLGRAAAARQAFSKALALEPGRPGLRCLRQLASAADGQPWEESGLAEAEVNSLHLAQALATAGKPPKLSGQFADRPLVGQADGLWRALLQMADDPKSAPVAHYAEALAAAVSLTRSPVAAYYAGVVALRKGDKAAALPVWRRLASEQLFSTPWFRQNTTLLTRDRASQLAGVQDWPAIVALQPSAADFAADSVLSEVVAAAHSHLGYAAAQTNDWQQAADHWQRANELAPDRRVAQNLALAQERLANWHEAATAWREMVRRRPRKADHPDFLTDNQVAAIWRHAADCYAQVGDTAEEIACLKSALKYSEADPDLRLRLASVYLNDDRSTAARNELERLVEIAPDHVQGLSRLAALYQMNGMEDPMPLWRRVLALEPANQDAKDALAQCYIELADQHESQSWLGRLTKRSEKQKLKVLQSGLTELPDHPALLLALGNLQVEIGDHRAARSSLRRAWEARPTDPSVVGPALHDLLHAKGDDIVEELLPSARAMPDLLAAFWISQARQAIACELGERWIDRFCEEALALAELRRGSETPVLIYISICETVQDSTVSAALREKWETRARAEAGHAGLGEFIEAQRAAQAGNKGKALGLLRKGRQLASKANEPGAVQYFEEIESLLRSPLAALAGMVDDLDIGELMRMFDEMNRRERRKR